MNNTAKELAKYIRKGNDTNEDVILRAASIPNPLFIENMPPYTKNVEPENALIFKNENENNEITFKVKYTDLATIQIMDYKLLFSYDGVNWGDIPVDTDGISFKLIKGDKVMFRANNNSNATEFGLLYFQNTSAGGTDFVTVTGNISALVSKDCSIQSATSVPQVTPSVFNSFRFRNFEINSTKNSKIDSMLLGLFDTCTFQTMSFDCDNYRFTTFSAKHNMFSDAHSVAIFVKTHESLPKLFDELTDTFASITTIVKIYDTEEPNMLYKDDGNIVCGILDRNIGAKSIFDCGYFFELAKKPIKPWTIDEIYNTKSFPFDGTFYLTNCKDYLDTIKYFCGPHYTFFTDDLVHDLMPYAESLNLSLATFGYPIMILRTMPFEISHNASIHTGILLTTFVIKDEIDDLMNLPYALFYAPDTAQTYSYYYSYIDRVPSKVDNMCFRTLRPCVIAQEVTYPGTSAYIYEKAEKMLNVYRV